VFKEYPTNKGRAQAHAETLANPDPFLLKSVEGDEMIKRFLKDETGLELSEYAVAAALIALAVVGAFQVLGTNIDGKIRSLANTIG
jgi:pilus assembly protein Flp/PilA